jgi:threonine 3-dehydrogenase
VPGPNDVLIKIKKTAVCGTDLHIYNWDEWSQKTVPVPMITGHEFFGVIHQLGSAVKDYRVGDRVSGEGHLTCDNCRNCRAGKRIPATNAFKIPESISDDVASMFDPYGNAVHTALSFDLVGEDVLITGAGPIGIMAVAIAKHVGARHVVITDVNDYRLELAKSLGATRAVNATKENLSDVMRDLNMTEGFDVGLEMSGNASAFQSMLKSMNHGGKVAILGIFPKEVAIDWSQVIFKGLFLKGIYGREMYETWYKMTAMLQSGLKIDKVITHRFGVDDFEKAFTAMNEGKAAKVVLDWTK